MLNARLMARSGFRVSSTGVVQRVLNGNVHLLWETLAHVRKWILICRKKAANADWNASLIYSWLMANHSPMAAPPASRVPSYSHQCRAC